MNKVRKRMGSLLLSVCIVLTMLPTVAFADFTEITAFADLAEEVASQEVEFGTILDELNLPSTLTATVTSGSTSEVTVSTWVYAPVYDSNTAGTYTFTPTLDLSADVTPAPGVTPPTITVEVLEFVPVKALTVNPSAYTFDPLEEGYGYSSNFYLDKAEAKTFTMTNTGNTELTGLGFSHSNEVADWCTIVGKNSTLAPNGSVEFTVEPYSNLSAGTYTTTIDVRTSETVFASVPVSLTVTQRVPRLIFGGTDVHEVDTDFSGTGYGWNATTKTLTLTSDYGAGSIEFLDFDSETATLKLDGDVTIDETASWGSCLYNSGNLTIDLDGHTLKLITGGSYYDALYGGQITIQNGTLVARLQGSATDDNTSSIYAHDLTVENATVIADADSLDYGGIFVSDNLTLKQGAKVYTSGSVGLLFDGADNLNLESDAISLTAIGSWCGVAFEADLNYTAGSALKFWTNTDTTQPSPAGEGTLLSSKTRDECEALWVASKYVYIGTESPKSIVTVTNGTGSGEYSPNAVVSITADTAPSGKRFKEWTIQSGGVTLANAQASSTTFTMPANAVEITATYEDIPAVAPVITKHPQNVTVLVGDTATFTITADNATSYQWYTSADYKDIPWSNNGRIQDTLNKVSGATTSTLTINNVTEKMDGAMIYCNAYGEGNSNAGSSVAYLSVSVGGDITEHAVTVNNGTANPATAAANATITITANTAVSGKRFKEWTIQSGNVTLANSQATSTTFTMPANAVEVTATYTSGGGSSSGGSSGGSSPSGSSSANIATLKENQPNQPVTAVFSVTATVGTNGIASASIPDKAVTDAIAKAQAEASKQKKTENGISIGLNVTMPKGASTLTATLSRKALNSLVSAGVTNLEINGAPVRVSFDQKALKEIQKQTNGNINISIAPKTNLTETAKKIIGSRPVYNITVGHGNNDTVSSFGEGFATIAIPYTPANGEAISGLYAVYVDENGNATHVEGSTYDANSGSIIFTTTHFSMYGIGYTAPSEKLIDISNHWAKESISYVVDKEILLGITETTFAPDTAMTREMLVTALGKLAEVDVSNYTTNSFTDVKAGSTFQPYIEWAYEKGIIRGIGNNQFAPDRAITREEIAVIVTKFTKATEFTLPVTREATTYGDDSSISGTYKTAVTAMQQAGIMTGGTNNKFNPKSNATRAEVSSMLHRYIKLTVD